MIMNWTSPEILMMFSSYMIFLYKVEMLIDHSCICIPVKLVALVPATSVCNSAQATTTTQARTFQWLLKLMNLYATFGLNNCLICLSETSPTVARGAQKGPYSERKSWSRILWTWRPFLRNLLVHLASDLTFRKLRGIASAAFTTL